MRIIKIFLASSVVEFKNERYELAAFINSLNNICVGKGIFFEMKICEELSNAIAMERKQDEYNEFIRDSDYLFMLFGKSAGKYTIEEFDVALEQFKASGTPKIYTYFKRLPEGECAQKGVLDFMERLDKQLGHCYSTFDHLDTVKFALMLELFQDAKLGSIMEFRDGRVLLDKQPVMSLKHVPYPLKNT